MRLLNDRQYDHRKQAALEIEQKVRSAVAKERLQPAGERREVRRILDCLQREYIDNSQDRRTEASNKKAGLIGLASVAIGLESEIGNFLQQLVGPVLKLFDDQDNRVRYYACEALYNISKVAREAVLAHFNAIFEGLCKLFADVDPDVKNGVQVLDRLIKDIVTNNHSMFQVKEFVHLLAERMPYKNPFIRNLCLCWTQLLLKVPEVDVVVHLQVYLKGVFTMLGDQSRDIRANADACLTDLLRAVTSSERQKALQIISETAVIVVGCCKSNESYERLTSLCWLHEYVRFQTQNDALCTETWVNILPELLAGTLHCIDDAEDEIKRMAIETNNELLELTHRFAHEMKVEPLVCRLLSHMQTQASPQSVPQRTACLQWICMLLAQNPAQMLQRDMLHRLFSPLFGTLMLPDDEVVVAALRVLAQIMEGRDQKEDEKEDSEGDDTFTVVAKRLLKLFASDKKMLESRGRLMIRQLCGHLDPRRLYVTVARAIDKEIDIQFAQQLVQTFSWILLTATETKVLRDELARDSGSRDGQQASPLFLELLKPWFHNPVSALALCLWAQQFELATQLTARFAALEPTLDLLKQLDQLVHLLESPVFSSLRLKLLEPKRHPELLRCLLGLAMLLPQASAFHTLRERIHVVQSGLLLEAQCREPREPDPRAGNAHERDGRSSWWSKAKAEDADTEGRGGGVVLSQAEIGNLMDCFDAVTDAARS